MNHTLDITAYKCPITFVKTRVLLSRMACGETATILLRNAETIESLPKTLPEVGCSVISLKETSENGVFEMVIKKS